MTLYRKWSTKVQLPVGTEWGVPYTSSVAECMHWPTASPGVPDPYHDSLGKSKARAPESKVEELRHMNQCKQHGVRFDPNLEHYDSSRLNGELCVRAPTPMKARTENYADKFSSYYVENGPSGQCYGLSRREDYGRDTDRSVAAHIRARSVGPCESYRKTERYGTAADDDAALIAEFLDARDSETYEKAKQDLYEHTYQTQLEGERKRLCLERQKEYEAHVNAHSGRYGLNEGALKAALAKESRASSAYRPAVRPPLPRPPAGTKSEHQRAFTDPWRKTHKALYEPRENLCIHAPTNTETALRNLHQAALSRTLLHSPDLDAPLPPSKPVKRVNFRSRPQSAVDGYHSNRSRKGGHFFVWRNASEDPMLRDDLWRMQKYQNVKSRVDNRWSTDPFSYKKKDDGKVDLKLECPQGEEMNVNLRVEATPSRTGYIY